MGHRALRKELTDPRTPPHHLLQAAELEQAQAEAAAADGGPARGGKGTYAGKAAAMKARRLSGMG